MKLISAASSGSARPPTSWETGSKIDCCPPEKPECKSLYLPLAETIDTIDKRIMNVVRSVDPNIYKQYASDQLKNHIGNA
jgi:hypothetical protein